MADRTSPRRLARGLLLFADGSAEPISPELCLVCPELADAVRKLDPGPVPDKPALVPDELPPVPEKPARPPDRHPAVHVRMEPSPPLRRPGPRRQPVRPPTPAAVPDKPAAPPPDRPPAVHVRMEPSPPLRRPGPRRQPVRPPAPAAVPRPAARRRRPRFLPAAAAAAALLVLTAVAASAVTPEERVRVAIPVAPAGASREPAPPAPATKQPARALIVPPLCQQPYVFAKGILQESGFAWKVTGGTEGFAANLVATQSPPPGTIVRDTGAPLIAVELRPNPSSPARGTPDDGAPYPATAVRSIRGNGWSRSASKILSLFRSRCHAPEAIDVRPSAR